MDSPVSPSLSDATTCLMYSTYLFTVRADRDFDFFILSTTGLTLHPRQGLEENIRRHTQHVTSQCIPRESGIWRWEGSACAPVSIVCPGEFRNRGTYVELETEWQGRGKPNPHIRVQKISLPFISRMESTPENLVLPTYPSICSGLSPAPTKNQRVLVCR